MSNRSGHSWGLFCLVGMFLSACASETTEARSSAIHLCGDGLCQVDEGCASCPGDCGPCSQCGNGICNAAAGETCATCPADCRRSELCNGVDDDCDGVVDDGANACGGVCVLAVEPGTACDAQGPGDLDSCPDDVIVCSGRNATTCANAGIDRDGDGYSLGTLSCIGDCDDGRAATHPGAAEVCGDEVDQDCDGIDLQCPSGCVDPRGPIDYAVRPPPAVTLPPRGGSYLDPTFGTKIIRVTDASDGDDNRHAYAYWSAFNADSTRFHIVRGGEPTLYAIDPTTDTIEVLGPLFAGAACDWEDALWSHTDPNLLYCHTSIPKRLYAYDLRKPGQLTLLHDFDVDLPAASDLRMWQLLGSADDDVFTFHTRDSSDQRHKAVVWVRSTNKLYVRDYTGQKLDETGMDGAGGFALVQVDDRWDVWDFRAGTVTPLRVNAVERGGRCHAAYGNNLLVSGDCWETGLMVRPFDDPLAWDHLVSTVRPDGVSRNWSLVVDPSINQRDQRFSLVSLWTWPAADPASWNPWDEEILAVAIDGSWVLRLAHHHSAVQLEGYWAQPRASISSDGRYAIWTSLFDGIRRDVFILKMPALCP